MFQVSDVFHPGAFFGGCFQLFLDGLSYELPQWNSALGRDRFCLTKQDVGDFEGCFHDPILPYLWEYGGTPQLTHRYSGGFFSGGFGFDVAVFGGRVLYRRIDLAA